MTTDALLENRDACGSPDMSSAATDRALWNDFIRNPDIVPWIELIICGRLGYRPDDLVLGSMINNAWITMATCTGYRRAGACVQTYAIAIIHNVLRRRGRRHRTVPLADIDVPDLRAAEVAERRETVQDVRAIISRSDGDDSAWAQAYLRALAVPDDPEHRRPAPMRAAQQDLGWTRYRCASACAHAERRLRSAGLAPTISTAGNGGSQQRGAA